MADLLDAACQSESPQTAKRMRLDHGCSPPPCPMGGAVSPQEEDSSKELCVTPGYSIHDKVLKGLNRQRLSGTLCDVTLCCEGQEFLCHRAVLASFSSYFEALLAASDLLEFTAVQKGCRDFMKDHMDNSHPDGAGELPSSPETEGFWDQDHCRNVFKGLNRQRLSGTLCDVTLCCEEQEVSCHRAVLASLSSYFEAMFTSGMRESTQDRVTISGVEPHMIGVLVNYVYTGEVSVTKAHVQALLEASDLFDVKDVRRWCCSYLERHVDINNCVETYCLAEAHSCEGLKKHCMDYIREHFSDIYQQEEFLSLSVERLVEIISSDHLNVPKEDMVFDAAMLWLDKNPTRKNNFEKVLEQIRLPLLLPSFLQHVVESLEVVKDQQGCQSFISEAKEPPCFNTARPRTTTVIVTVGVKRPRKGVNTFECFDPLTKEWKTVGPLPFKTKDPAMVASGSTLYLAGGYKSGSRISHGGDSCEMWRYDAQNSWVKMASMKEGRCFFSLVVLDGYVFAVGGAGRGCSDPSIECYDPGSDTWQLMETAGGREHYDVDSCDVVALDGHLYFIGGDPKDEDEPGGQMAKYNPNTSVWTQLAPMKIPRNESAACVLNGKIYVTGGLCYYEGGEQGVENTVECYNPQTDQWTMCAPMGGRYMHSAVADSGKMYVLGGTELGPGYDDYFGYAGDIECYCEETDTWEIVGRTPAARFSLRSVSLKLSRYHGYQVESGDDDNDYDNDSDDWLLDQY